MSNLSSLPPPEAGSLPPFLPKSTQSLETRNQITLIQDFGKTFGFYLNGAPLPLENVFEFISKRLGDAAALEEKELTCFLIDRSPLPPIDGPLKGLIKALSGKLEGTIERIRGLFPVNPEREQLIHRYLHYTSFIGMSEEQFDLVVKGVNIPGLKQEVLRKTLNSLVFILLGASQYTIRELQGDIKGKFRLGGASYTHMFSPFRNNKPQLEAFLRNIFWNQICSLSLKETVTRDGLNKIYQSQSWGDFDLPTFTKSLEIAERGRVRRVNQAVKDVLPGATRGTKRRHDDAMGSSAALAIPVSDEESEVAPPAKRQKLVRKEFAPISHLQRWSSNSEQGMEPANDMDAIDLLRKNEQKILQQLYSKADTEDPFLRSIFLSILPEPTELASSIEITSTTS